MLKSNGKISVRQAFILSILAMLSPTIRIFPNKCAWDAETAAWLTPIAASISLIILYSVLSAYFQNKNLKNLDDVFKAALGNAAGKILLIVFLLWFVIILWLYIRYYAARLSSTIYPNTDVRFFILAMVFLAYFAAKGKIETFCRFAEIIFLSFTLVLIILFIFLLPEVEIGNIYPVTYYDIIPVLKATRNISPIWGYILLPFFFGDSIFNKDEIKKFGKQSTIYLVVISTLILITIVGALGPTVAQRMSFSFFNAIKVITFMESFDRFESIMLAIWVAADFIVITLLLFVITTIIKNLFSLSERKYLTTPIAAIGYIGSRYFTVNRFEIETFTSQFFIYVNIILLYIAPIAVFLIGKIRKKI
ncbi:MAG: hypothetical protein CVU91_10620 [Firmicutes bacterium HGW-Firmicutes-16]|nr:MAG: hypothetical protein CVU91_10620 [Firmicutes bacterium HGW-Firmicutes-16]